MQTLEDLKLLLKQTQMQQKNCLFYIDDYEINLTFQAKKIYMQIFLYKNLTAMELDGVSQQLIQKNSQIIGQYASSLAIISVSSSIVLRMCLSFEMRSLLLSLESALNHADTLLAKTYI
jgi:hypothetical protein